MMMRIHGRVLTQQPPDPRAWLNADVVIGVGPGRVLVLFIADHFRQVLEKIAAERDVQHLAPAADREHRQVALERR
jgi:hypothetical protein